MAAPSICNWTVGCLDNDPARAPLPQLVMMCVAQEAALLPDFQAELALVDEHRSRVGQQFIM